MLIMSLFFVQAWDWVYDNIVPSLLKLLGSHVSEEFLAAILILVGQVGRYFLFNCLGSVDILRFMM